MCDCSCVHFPQAVKNLVFLAKTLHRLMEADHMTHHVTTSVQCSDEVNGDDGCHGYDVRNVCRDLHWLVGRMTRLARNEAGKHPQQSLKVKVLGLCVYM